MRVSAFFFGLMLGATGAVVHAQGSWQALPRPPPTRGDLTG